MELNLANKYHNAIFVNGHSFTAENITRGSGSRAVHLFAGGAAAVARSSSRLRIDRPIALCHHQEILRRKREEQAWLRSAPAAKSKRPGMREDI